MTYTKTINETGTGTRFKLRAFSAPLQRRRTPDDLPMDHTRHDLHILAKYRREQRLRTKEELRQTALESESLREYSQRRFDYAVQTFTQETRPSTCPGYRPTMTCFHRPGTSTGPTRLGSVLYNKTPLLLNTLRLRPQSRASGYFEHVHSEHPDIQKMLYQSNFNYHVSHLPESRAATAPADVDDFILVPLSYGDRLDGYVSDARAAWDDGASGSGSRHTPSSVERSSAKAKIEATLTPTSSRPAVSLQQTVRPGHRTSDGEVDEHTKKSEIETEPRGSTGGPSVTSIPNQPLGEKSSSSHLAVRPPRTTNSGTAIPGSRHSSISSGGSLNALLPMSSLCWVDNVTVSSDVSPEHMSEDEGEHVEGVSKTGVDAKGVVETGQTVDENVAKTTPGDVEPTTAAVVSEEQVLDSAGDLEEEPTIELPTFLCPSSEKKSRHEAIKHWLAKTSYTLAEKTVPLL